VKYIVIAFLLYLLFRFIFNFLIPLITTTRQIKKGFNEMKSRMEEKQQQQSPSYPAPPSNAKHGDDYIEFEEIPARKSSD
jgi:hypothetical protein